jgi:hypothetical protein
MAKEKKFSTTLVIQPHLKGVILANGDVKHSLYVRLVYDRKQALFTVASLLPELDNKDKTKSVLYATENEIPKLAKGFLGQKIFENLDVIIMFEKEIFKDKFSVSGLGKRIKLYKNNAYEALKEIIEDKEFKEKVAHNFFRLYEFFYKEMEKHPELKTTYVIDWFFDLAFEDRFTINKHVHNYLYENYDKERDILLQELGRSLFDEDILLMAKDKEKAKKYLEKRIFSSQI